MPRVLTSYVDNDVADAIEDACAKSGRKKSAVIQEILREHFFSKESYELHVKKLSLEELRNQQKQAELDLVDIQKKVTSLEIEVTELEGRVSTDWIESQLEQAVLSYEKPDEIMSEFSQRVDNIPRPWLKASVEGYLKNGGKKEIKSKIKGMISD